MKLSVRFLHECNPELILFRAMAIKRLFLGLIVRDKCINNNILPSSILEELKDGKSLFDVSTFNNQVLQQLWSSAKNEESSHKPTVTNSSLLDISRCGSISAHHWLIWWWTDFLRPFPLNNSISSIFRFLQRVFEKSLVVCFKLLVNPRHSLVVFNVLTDKADCLLDLFCWRKLFLVCLLIIFVKSNVFAFITVVLLAEFVLNNWQLMLILAMYSSLVVSPFVVNVVLLLVSIVMALKLLLVQMLLIIMFSMHHLFFVIILHLLLLILI